MIIDVHGHYTTAPAALGAWRDLQIAGLKDPSKTPSVADLKISDDEIRETIETNQLRLMKERGSDLTIFSPRASFMAHHIGDFRPPAPGPPSATSCASASAELFPDHFIPAAMLPQSPGVDPHLHSRAGQVRGAIRQRGHQPEPRSLGRPLDFAPAVRQELVPHLRKDGGVRHPAMIHVSTSCNAASTPRAATTCRHHGLHAVPDFGSVQGLPDPEVPDSPWRRRVPYHWGRFRGLAQEMKKPLLEEHLLNNIYFDTCVYHQPGINLLTEVIPTKNILFASEMIGAVRGIDPQTGHYYDDTKRYIEATSLTAMKSTPSMKAMPAACSARLDKALKAKGLR
jgi:4-oxalmesaconate hydratase